MAIDSLIFIYELAYRASDYSYTKGYFGLGINYLFSYKKFAYEQDELFHNKDE